MGDVLVRGISQEHGVRAVIAITTDAVNEAARRHKSTPTATVVLSRVMTAGALAGTLVKVKQHIALKFEGDGPLKKLIAESDAYGRIRGYVQEPKVEVERDDFGRIDVPAALGNGILHASKDVGRGQLIEGVVNLTHSNIEGDFQAFLIQSEQIASIVQFDSKLADDGKIEMAAGLMLQSIGDEGNETVLDQLTDRLEEMPPVLDMLLSGQTPQQIFDQLFGESAFDILEERKLEFNCRCSYARSEKAIRMLDREDIEGLIEEGQAVVDCHFCHERYVFTVAELQTMLI